MFFTLQMMLMCTYNILKLVFKEPVCLLLLCEASETCSTSWLLTLKPK